MALSGDGLDRTRTGSRSKAMKQTNNTDYFKESVKAMLCSRLKKRVREGLVVADLSTTFTEIHNTISGTTSAIAMHYLTGNGTLTLSPDGSALALRK
jgi:hypothetical protein